MTETADNFPYKDNLEFNQRLGKVVYWCAMLYVFVDRALLFIFHFFYMICGRIRGMDRLKSPILLLSIPFGLQYYLTSIMCGYGHRVWKEIMNAGTIGRGFWQSFMYICLIPFLSIIYAQRKQFDESERAGPLLDVINNVRTSIILLSCKIVCDIWIGVVAGEALDN